MQSTFVKSVFLMGRYIPTIGGVDMDNGYIREPAEYEKRVQRVSATDRFGSSGVLNFFALVSDGGNEGNGLWVAMKLLLFKMGGRGSNGSKGYMFLLHMGITFSIDSMDVTLECVSLR